MRPLPNIMKAKSKPLAHEASPADYGRRHRRTAPGNAFLGRLSRPSATAVRQGRRCETSWLHKLLNEAMVLPHEDVLVLAESDDDGGVPSRMPRCPPSPPPLKAGSDVHLLVAGQDCGQLRLPTLAAKIAGVAKVHVS